jgi:Ca2+-transporting ATPase
MALNEEDLKLKHPFWAMTPSETSAVLGVSSGGLDVEEAERRLGYGRNKIKTSGRAGKIKILLSQFKNPLILILVFAVCATVSLNDVKDAAFISVAILINAALGFYQENKAESALAKLETYIKERTRVVRDSRDIEIDSEEIVPGDLLKLTPGGRVPADARVIRANNLSLDEAILTGESLPVEKSVLEVGAEMELAERSSMVFGGTLVVGGVGLAVVTSTGENTELGKIAELVRKNEKERTPLQEAIRKFALRGSLVLFVLTVTVFIIGIRKGFDLLDMFLTSVAIAVAAVPEGLPIAITVILAVGVERLAKRRGVVRKLLAAETLGSTTLILTDKTGTLTEARMKLAKIMSDKPDVTVLELAMLNTDVIIGNPSGRPEDWQFSGNPIEVAIIRAGVERGIMPRSVFKRNHILESKPFNAKDKFSAVHARIGTRSRWIYLGAPDLLLEKVKTAEDQKREMLSKIDELAYAGHRVLGVAVDNNLIGLLAFKDPVRPSVGRTIAEAKRAGVRTVIMTGDHKGTAISVAKELGFELNEGGVVVGEDLRNITDEELNEILEKASIFARVTPEDKLKIAEAYKKRGEVVAVTGDGINDAPALKGADIGVALGSGSDVAKGSADLILLDNNFETIIEAIKEGRRILDNIRKVIVYLFSGILDELILIGGALLAGVSLPLNALQILWVNFFSDSFPAVALAFEGDDNRLRDRSVFIKGKLLNREMKFLIGVVGVVTSLLLLFLYFYLLSMGFGIQLVKTFIFAAFSVGTFFSVFSIRSLGESITRFNLFSNKYLICGVLAGFIQTGLAIYLPTLQEVLGTVALPFPWLVGVLAVGLTNIVFIESGKLIFRIGRKL